MVNNDRTCSTTVIMIWLWPVTQIKYELCQQHIHIHSIAHSTATEQRDRETERGRPSSVPEDCHRVERGSAREEPHGRVEEKEQMCGQVERISVNAGRRESGTQWVGPSLHHSGRRLICLFGLFSALV